MKLITRDTDYAIRSLIYFAKGKNSIISVNQLVEDLKIPRAFLRKILQVLSANHLLASTKGKRGGFYLAREPKKIRIFDVAILFQKKLPFTECFFKKNICPEQRTCPLRKRLLGIERYIVMNLKDMSIASLLS